ncbi:MAG TPA: hypothetical protein QF753_18100 [Victivallales bacterium]|nr:hypothetical protein [Victivallales bacterium]
MSIRNSIKATTKKIWNNYTEAMSSYNEVMIKYHTCATNKKDR